MFQPTLLRPLPHAGRTGTVVDPWSPAPFTTISGPVGTTVPEHLATALDNGRRWGDCVWLRPDPGATPATIVVSLIEACRHRWAGPGDAATPDTGADLSEVVALAPSGAVMVIQLRSRSRRAATPRRRSGPWSGTASTT